MIYTDSAIVKLRISSPKLLRLRKGVEPMQEYPEGLLIEFFDPVRGKSGSLSAKYAIRNEETGFLMLRDSVVWRSLSGESLETEELTWDNNSDRVHTGKFVVVKRAEEILYGYGFESNQNFTNWGITAIEGRIRASEITDDLTNK
jgi:LPS export ABC transporter protein LptC